LSYEPRLSTNWLANVALLQRITMLPVPTLDHCMRPPSAQVVLANIMPQPPVTRTMLSRGLQHTSSLVQFSTLCVIEAAWLKFSRVEQAFQEMQMHTQESEAWGKALNDVQTRLWTMMPDIQTVIGLMMKKAEDQRSDILYEKALSVLGYFLRYMPSVSGYEKKNT
jgi:nucleolar pre-ribosomal-associated protein 1